MLPWPVKSPNLSPIELIWDIIGRQFHQHPQPALIVPVLTQQLQQAWNSIPRSDIRHLEAPYLLYKEMIIEPSLRLFKCAVGTQFLVVGDKTYQHQNRMVDKYLDIEIIQRMEFPARSPDLNHVQNFGDIPARAIAAS
ncbi:uncharacterized protein TNCV_4663201 [Trichonephila clavipes]|uniref:Tc1-like transposase DDE domain-containing protein n=1 Tax=Trichonephila clavipes TaxID=2585209 RepID=A0A8X6VJ33_TRICX|nr:uncharacterized protein TNCV_4663201 [Trichonephila clavipes]